MTFNPNGPSGFAQSLIQNQALLARAIPEPDLAEASYGFEETVTVSFRARDALGNAFEHFDADASTRLEALGRIKADIDARIREREEGIAIHRRRLESLAKLRAHLETELANAT
jgi:hypothetical protein